MTDNHRLRQLTLRSLTEEDCPPSEQVAAFALGLLEGNEQLQIAAHVRRCPLCTHDVNICLPPQPRPKRSIARFMPLALAPGRRSTTGGATARRFVSADIEIELTIAQPAGDIWRITGQILKAEAPLIERGVTLRQGRRRFVQTTDSLGFFTFDNLPSGRYTLSLTDGDVQVQIQSIVLSLTD